ncbi:MAG: membrane protein insertion efficiency factor YidD [Candidatus Contendobacter sp.]|nr:membrane protein insertion efficiency factor YidD [Gammaproteobacteria bacterium]MCC8993296.1 membrane protein insertion efficiency factor YidD [Candidatus Contendobacter sp.]
MKSVDRLALAAITAYQRHLSPRKGFCCAHRVQHGGPSCSEYARQTLIVYGLRQTAPLLRQRLLACREAARAFIAERDDKDERNKPWWRQVLDCMDIFGACDGGCVPDSCDLLRIRR